MDEERRKGFEGQVKILVESLDEKATGVLKSDEDVRSFMESVIFGLSRGCPSSFLKTAKTAPKRLVPRDFDPDYQEFSVDVESSDWEHALFRLVENFFAGGKLFRSTYNRPDVVSLLQLSSFNLLKRDFVPSDSNLPAEFFCLGNLMNPFNFINHFKLSEENVNLELLNECEKSKNNTNGILVDFEHDRNLLKVRFGYATKPSKASSEWQEAVVYIHVPYGAIRRIIVDWDNVNELTVEGCKIYLHLNWPVEIKKSKKKDRGWQHTERFLSWDRNTVPPKAISDCPVLMVAFLEISKVQLYNCLSRLRSRCNLVLEFCRVRMENAAPYVPSPMCDDKLKRIIVKHDCYGLGYLIEALSSRGAVVNDHLLTSLSARNAFINKILNAFEDNKKVTLETLERMLNTLDEHLEIRNITRVFDRIHEKVSAESLALQVEEDAQQKEGFQRVRKVVITPTRKLLVVPELLMGNRFLRTHDETGDQTLRVQFRDDDSQHLRGIKCGSFLIERTVGEALRNGVVVAGRLYKYMGSSNSQMRDNGCYFFNADTGENIHEKIRSQFGKFDTDNIPKFMSRFGQCFTQARRSDVTLERHMYKTIADVSGGEDKSHKEYTFSDGVGNISIGYATKISDDMDLDGCVPSVFQIRFRGIKGIVCVNPQLDFSKEFIARFKLEDKQDEDNRMDCDIHFRPSQEKFRAPRDEKIEIVKYSAPTPMSLNRPMINIMDQVTAMQNQATHNRLCARVHELLDIQLESLGKCLTDENKARERLNELPRRIDFGYLSSEKGFLVTEEPFFRSLLQSCVQYTLRKLRTKIQVQIPANQGRMLFGVIDESGLLQYGQIFCQITTSIIVKTPSKSAARQILEGPVLMTKNPSIVAGDVRMFQAVNIPELHHLVDVIVFPRYGHRPHPDEMAGSDLDGDEYAIMWDPELFFDRNEEPLDFPKPVLKTDPNDDRDVNTKMIDFYISYIEQDSIGTIANSFLVMSDLYGIDSRVCIAIARKHSLAVDFPKTGKPPEKLTRQPRNGMPPEQPDRFPDFMERDSAPSYISSSLNGQLYRRAKEIDVVLAQAMDRQICATVMEDPDMIVEGSEKYEDDAFTAVNSYNACISALLDNYGITDEAQAFTGAIIKCRNRISDKDNDDMSMFNTNFVVEQRINRIFQRARRAFFEEFGGFERCTVEEVSSRQNKNLVTMMEEGDLDRRFCKNPTLEMKQKASACYKACYFLASSADRRFLSFAWICWDILGEIKRESHFRKADRQLSMGVPLHGRLHAFVVTYAQDRSNTREFQNYKEDVLKNQQFLSVYTNAFQGLHELCFLLKKWGDEHDLFNYEFTPECLNALLLLHGIDGFPVRRDDAKSEWLEKTDPGVRVIPKSLLTRIGGLGAILLDFLKYLGSREFKQFSCISLSPLNCSEVLTREICKPAARAAYHTYYHITFSGMFESLPQLATEVKTNADDLTDDGRRLYEVDPFTIELPFGKERELGSIMKNLKLVTGVHHLTMRKMKDDHRTRTVKMIVSGVGTLDSLEKLREVMSIKPNMRSGGNCIIAKANLMADMVYEKVRSRSKKGDDFVEERKFDSAMIAEIGNMPAQDANEGDDAQDEQVNEQSSANRVPLGERRNDPEQWNKHAQDAPGPSNSRPYRGHYRSFHNGAFRNKQKKTLAELRSIS
uniref:RNA-directed RNA polymerase n=1 Tax=Steinernema glaseri TaxID=37863 RepID=A0A1I8APC3_9BILA